MAVRHKAITGNDLRLMTATSLACGALLPQIWQEKLELPKGICQNWASLYDACLDLLDGKFGQSAP
ncbi:hypothetical protein ACFL6C_09155 [Myxococcota bacterium]